MTYDDMQWLKGGAPVQAAMVQGNWDEGRHCCPRMIQHRQSWQLATACTGA